MEVANATADAIERTYNTTWKRGNSCEFLCEIYINPITFLDTTH